MSSKVCRWLLPFVFGLAVGAGGAALARPNLERPQVAHRKNFFDELSELNAAMLKGLEADLSTAPDDECRTRRYRDWKARNDLAVLAVYKKHGRTVPSHLKD